MLGENNISKYVGNHSFQRNSTTERCYAFSLIPWVPSPCSATHAGVVIDVEVGGRTTTCGTFALRFKGGVLGAILWMGWFALQSQHFLLPLCVFRKRRNEIGCVRISQKDTCLAHLRSAVVNSAWRTSCQTFLSECAEILAGGASHTNPSIVDGSQVGRIIGTELDSSSGVLVFDGDGLISGVIGGWLDEIASFG